MLKVVVQIGFKNSYKEHQRISAYLNSEKVTWTKRENGEYNGEFISPPAKRGTETWFLVDLDCEDADLLRVEVEVFIKGKGPDEERSCVVEFTISDLVNPMVYQLDKVGDSHFPVAAGKMTVKYSRQKIEDRRDRAENLVQRTTEG